MAVGGLASLSGLRLSPGVKYYTSTAGQLVASGTLQGRATLSDPGEVTGYVSPRLQEYVETAGLIVLEDGAVGVAVSASSLLLTLV